LKSPISKAAPAPNSNCVPPHKRLRRADLPPETEALGRFLIGTLLIRRLDDGSLLAGRIVEAEAYAPGDPASHAFRGPTKRNRSMFEPHAYAYVYLIYGTSYCLNVVSEAAGAGGAILIRAAEPLAGLDRMRANRARPGLADRDLARGPGNLTRAFGIGPACDGLDLDVSPQLYLGGDGTKLTVGTSTRIGITRAVERPHRFYARGSPALSGPRSLSP